MKKKDQKKITEGNIFSSLVRLAWPIILANILQTAYQLIDTFWLGRLGADAVAAVSLSFPILFLVLSLDGGLTLAGGLLGIQQVLNGVFNGAGFTKASLLISLFSMWVIRFPTAYVLSYNTQLNFEGIWWAFPISNFIAAIVAFGYYKIGYWKLRTIRYRHQIRYFFRWYSKGYLVILKSNIDF